MNGIISVLYYYQPQYLKQKVIKMGGKHPQPQLFTLTPQLIEKSCLFIANHQGITFAKTEVSNPIKIILQSLRQKQPLQKKENFIQINPSYLKLIFSPVYSKQIMKLVQLLILQLQQLNKKSLTFLKVEQIMELTYLADFILYFSNEKTLQTFDTLLVRSDLSDQNKKLLKQLAKLQDGQLQINGNIVQRMNSEQQQMIQKSLRVTIMSFINLRQQVLSRSENTLKYFSFFEQSLFMLYSKIYFAIHGSNKQQNISILNQHFRSNLIIGAYFLSSGTSCVLPSLYEAAVVFLYSFLKVTGVQYKQIKNLPTHMFKNLPVISTSSMYQYILVNILFTLKYIKQGKQTYIRFSFNRIFSLKLVECLLKKTKICNKTITYYLEELCLQVKVGQIQRAYVAEIVEIYRNTNKDNEQIQKSQLLTKFLQSGNIKYNLKFPDRHVKISKQQLLTQLEDQDDTCKKQYYSISHKYVLERILCRQVIYNFNDRLLWQQILPSVINNKEDQDVRKSKRKLEGDGYDSDSEEEEGKEGKAIQERVSVLELGEDNKVQQQE